jgi:hypothetical protein
MQENVARLEASQVVFFTEYYFYYQIKDGMGGACSVDGMIRNAYKLLVAKLDGKKGWHT